ncbi:hypothetical protein LOC68_12885 [Blastopirellula sp. JC732]|uniref:Uncharacterized protein n=1 Tax=Blastopirellula sediminis TaxID=2894196 RepID=A0A9X1SGS5_9BACT|nr:hypothetical protein [Blastopirellula sediminis]MCC9607415.1 hypothetical protein [Blastopirellula sediminis]MCC9629292.1 hypothetical protein [Blastopirellula sediminis]
MKCNSLALAALVLATLCGVSVAAEEETPEADARLFEFAEPITAIMPQEMQCKVKASGAGVYLILSLPEQELDARGKTNLPFGKRFRGDWELWIKPVVGYSVRDAEKIKEMTSSQSFGKLDPTRYVKVDDQVFEIRYPSYRPVDEKQQAIIETFVKRLSKKTTMLDGSSSEENLQKWIVDP